MTRIEEHSEVSRHECFGRLNPLDAKAAIVCGRLLGNVCTYNCYIHSVLSIVAYESRSTPPCLYMCVLFTYMVFMTHPLLITQPMTYPLSQWGDLSPPLTNVTVHLRKMY